MFQGTPLVAYTEGGYDSAQVLEFDGVAWKPVGESPFINEPAGWFGFALYNGEFFTGYADRNGFPKVMKYR
jgi:hypothetical protein